ncbi:MAG: hypothetical protein HWN67_20500 [Candidatus Helarchaeota archaeon]|nr:hypothetical protein [Candidatus Helarchaeota archaeon]
MAQLTKELVDRLNEISQKLDIFTEGLVGLVESINKLGGSTDSLLSELSNKIDNYANILSTKSQEDFEVSKSQLISINEQIDKIRKGVGMEQMLKISDSLSGLLDTLGGADFNPVDLKNNLSEIKKYLESKKE